MSLLATESLLRHGLEGLRMDFYYLILIRRLNVNSFRSVVKPALDFTLLNWLSVISDYFLPHLICQLSVDSVFYLVT